MTHADSPPETVRGWSTLAVKSLDQDQRMIEGWASKPEIDRVGDIVEPLGCTMSTPMPLLWAHKHDEPVGQVVAANATKEGISIRARIAKITEPGPLKDSIDRAWQAVKAGLVQGLSIGFMPKEFELLEETGGFRFTKSEIYELSLVVVPACASATITLIKSLDCRHPAASGHTEPQLSFRRGASIRGLPKLAPIEVDVTEDRLDDIRRQFPRAKVALLRERRDGLQLFHVQIPRQF